MKGFGRIYQRGAIYWIEYWHRGQQFRESSGSGREGVAAKLLKKRLQEIGRGRFVGPSEEAGVSFQGVQQQSLIRFRQRTLVVAAEFVAQIGKLQLHTGVGHLGLQVHLDSFGRLNLHDQLVGFDAVAFAVGEHHVRRTMEANHDLRRAATHRLARRAHSQSLFQRVFASIDKACCHAATTA